MTPEQKLNEVYEFMQKLKANATIPKDVGAAFQARLGSGVLTVSSKGADTEDQAVAESGMDSYDVLGDPDGFLQITIDGAVYYLPYFN